LCHAVFSGSQYANQPCKCYEISHYRNITWMVRVNQTLEHISVVWIGTSRIVEMPSERTRDGKPFHVPYLLLASLRSVPEPLPQLMCDRCSIEGWHWAGDNQLHEDPNATVSKAMESQPRCEPPL
jgi:hypothetical protein